MSDENKSLNKKDQKHLDEKRGQGVGKDYVPFIKVGKWVVTLPEKLVISN